MRSIAFCAYRKEVFKKTGGFDPDLWVGQDGTIHLSYTFKRAEIGGSCIKLARFNEEWLRSES